MKRILIFILFAAVLIHGSLPVSAQYYPSFDESIRDMRMNAVGNTTVKYDDYLQYSSAALVLGLKLGGYEGRSSWGRMLLADAFSVAAMSAAVNGIKYSVKRMRPDNSTRNSFPSGHTATSFMVAAMLHEEYGWRSPWFSIAGYTAASVTGITRIVNNRHWATDVIAGAAIGIASVKLGYFLTGLILKDIYQNERYSAPVPGFDPERKYFDAGLFLGYRFLLGGEFPVNSDGTSILPGGAVSGLEFSIPIASGERLKGTAGVAARLGINACYLNNGLSFNTYDFLAGGYWRHAFARVLETDAQLLAGYSLPGNTSISRPAGLADGFTLSCGGSFGVATGENFKIKLFARYEISDISVRKGMVQGAVVGGSASIFW